MRKNNLAVRAATSEPDDILFTRSPELDETEALIREFRGLIARSETSHEEKSVRREVDVLEQWMAAYRRCVAKSRRISEAEKSMLRGLVEFLKITLAEYRRDNEGTPPREHYEKIAERMKTLRRIERMLSLAQAFHS